MILIKQSAATCIDSFDRGKNCRRSEHGSPPAPKRARQKQSARCGRFVEPFEHRGWRARRREP
jgi:hypothetical protein